MSREDLNQKRTNQFEVGLYTCAGRQDLVVLSRPTLFNTNRVDRLRWNGKLS